jgi:hypothetical protein
MAAPHVVVLALSGALLAAAASAAPRSAGEREDLARSLLPDVPLRLALRCVAPNAASAAPGSVVVGTSVEPEAGAGGRTWRSSPAASGAPLMELTVANGELGSLRWKDERSAAREYELVGAWLPVGAAASSPRGGAAVRGIGVQLQPVPVVDGLRELQVEPRWLGGSEPVRVTLATRQEGAARPGWSVQTVLQTPLDRWTTVARAVDGAGAPGCLLQLRVSRPPR